MAWMAGFGWLDMAWMAFPQALPPGMPGLGASWEGAIKSPPSRQVRHHAICRIEMPCPEACRDAATLDFRKRWLSMSYKTERGNVDFFWLRFHALVEMLSDYQSVTKDPVAASRRWTLTGAFWQWFGCAPAGVLCHMVFTDGHLFPCYVTPRTH